MFLGNSSFIVLRKYLDIITRSALLIKQISKGVLLEKVKPDVFKGLSDMEYKSVSLSRPERTIYGLSVSSLITFWFHCRQKSYFLVLLMAAYITVPFQPNPLTVSHCKSETVSHCHDQTTSNCSKIRTMNDLQITLLI